MLGLFKAVKKEQRKADTHACLHSRKIMPTYEAYEAYEAGDYPRFCSMERLRVFLPPSGWDAGPSRGYPSN